MQSIKASFISGNNTLYVDSQNALYITGDNSFSKATTSTTDSILNTPCALNIKLDSDEQVSKFKSFPRNICIYTTRGRLIELCSRNTSTYPSNKMQSPVEMKTSKKADTRSNSELINIPFVAPGTIDSESNTKKSKAKKKYSKNESKKYSKNESESESEDEVISIASDHEDLLSDDYVSESEGEDTPRRAPRRRLMKKRVEKAEDESSDDDEMPSDSDSDSELSSDEEPKRRAVPKKVAVKKAAASRVIPSAKKWNALMNDAFDRLSHQDQEIYLTTAKERIQQAIHANEKWTRNSDLLADVLSQIERGAGVNATKTDIPDTTTTTTSTVKNSTAKQIPVVKPLSVAECLIAKDLMQRDTISSMAFKAEHSCFTFLITEGVKSIMFGADEIVYQIGNSLFVESFNYNPKFEIKGMNYYCLVPLRTCCERNHVREICLPFPSLGKCQFIRNFVYLQTASQQHHIIKPINGGTQVLCASFTADFTVNPNNLRWSNLENTFHLRHEGTIYRYLRTQRVLEPFMKSTVSNMFSAGFYSDELCVVDDTGFMCGGGLHKLRDYDVSFKNMTGLVLFSHDGSTQCMDMRTFGNNCAVLVLCDSKEQKPKKNKKVSKGSFERIKSSHKTLFLETNGLKWWGLISPWCFGFIEKGELYILANKSYTWSSDLSRKISDFKTIIYMKFPIGVSDTDIKSVVFNGGVMITTAYGIYTAFSFNEFRFEFTPFNDSIKPPSNKTSYIVPPEMVEKELIVNQGSSISGTKSFTVQLHNTFLPILIACAEMWSVHTDLQASNEAYSKSVSSGGGVQRTFLDRALREFRETYFVLYNHLVEFKYECIKDLSDIQLYILGRMIVLAFNNCKSHLPIRLPIILIAAIKRSHPTIQELEYFAYKEDPNAYISLKKMTLEEMQQNSIASYHDGLKSITKLDTCTTVENHSDLYCRVRKIADGFLKHSNVHNLFNMNLPTLDNYLSGNYRINVEELIQKLHLSDGPKKQRFADILRKMSDEKLAILLANWSGSSVFVPKNDYNVSFTLSGKHFVSFTTCSQEMNLHPNVFSNYNDDEIINILSAECRDSRG